MMMVRTFGAVLLAAGHSRRMGTDKALLPAGNGGALWARQVGVLAAAGAAEIFISARPEQTWVPEGMTVVHDAVPEAGPLAGIVAALERATHGHLAVLAVDLSAMRAEWFAGLLAQCAPGVGAVGCRAAGGTEKGRSGERERRSGGEQAGFFEPLAAIYPREILSAARAALARGEGSLQRLIAAESARFAVRAIGAGEVAWFEHRNEPV